MISEESIKALVGHEFPGGKYTIAHWENFLLTECTGSELMQNNVVHPVALFHVPILGCNTTISELFELGDAHSEASIMIESYDWEMFKPLKEDIPYTANGKITAAEQRHNEDGSFYERIQFHFDLADPQGEPTATSTITWYYTKSA